MKNIKNITRTARHLTDKVIRNSATGDKQDARNRNDQANNTPTSGFLDRSYIVSDAALAIYDPSPEYLGVISSKMHMVWLKTTAGRLKSDYRYSIGVCYNTFPFPPISTQRKNEITQSVFRILEEREKHSDKTMAQLYDPDKMPEVLREAHRQNDLIIERCYRSVPFNSDEERLEYLFKLYEKMIAEEKETLFAKEKKTRKKSK